MSKSSLWTLFLLSVLVVCLGVVGWHNFGPPAKLHPKGQTVGQVASVTPNPVVYTSDNDLLKIRYEEASLEALMDALATAESPPEKSEYETASDYNRRRKSFAPKIGPYPGNTEFAVIVPTVSSYDAERGVLKFYVGDAAQPALAPALPSDGSPPSRQIVVLKSAKGPAAVYAGENAFGVKRAVEISTGSETQLMAIFDKSEKAEGISTFELPMSIAEAKLVQQKPAYVAYVLRFDQLPSGIPARFGTAVRSSEAPTLQAPHQTRISVDMMAGRIQKLVVFVAGERVLLSRSYS